MTVSVASFLVRCPDFANAGTSLLAAALADVELEVSSDAFGAQRDAVVCLKLADRLASSPSGRDARMVMGGGANQSTTYRRQLDELMCANAVRATRLGVVDR
jgi:hypothetical protein